MLSREGHRTKNGKPWSSDAVLTVLHNRTYLGKTFYRGQWYTPERHHPTIISPKLFADANTILTTRGDEHAHRAANSSDYLLAGLVFCTHCGKRYQGTAAGGNRYRYRYYTCFTRQRYGPEECPAERLPADQLEAGVIDSLLATLANTDLIDTATAHAELATQHRHRAAELSAIDTELAKTQASIDRYLTAFEAGTMPEATCAPRVAGLADKQAELRNRRDELDLLLHDDPEPRPPRAEQLTALAQELRDILDHANPAMVKPILQTLVHKIDVTGRQLIQPTFRVPTHDDHNPPHAATAPTPRTTHTPASTAKVRAMPGTVPLAGFEPATHGLPTGGFG